MKMRAGFTLIELVVVILILGILAAVAAPKLFKTSGTATDNGLRQTLSVVRDAIELYAANNGGLLPGADDQSATFKANLVPYLRKFPKNPVGAVADKLDYVKMRSVGNPLSSYVNNQEGWIYDNLTGEFLANSSAMSSDGVTAYSEF